MAHITHPNNLRTYKEEFSLKILEKVRIASLNLNFIGSYKKCCLSSFYRANSVGKTSVTEFCTSVIENS